MGAGGGADAGGGEAEGSDGADAGGADEGRADTVGGCEGANVDVGAPAEPQPATVRANSESASLNDVLTGPLYLVRIRESPRTWQGATNRLGQGPRSPLMAREVLP